MREWNAEAYDRLSDPQFGWGKKVVERVAALPRRGDETVLDAGCGTGRVTDELAQLFPRGLVVAVDLSENMVRTARENLSAKMNQVRFACTDISRLPFRAAFDGVFSTAVFHWVTDHPRLFRGLHSALKREGWLIAQCGGGPNLKRLRDRARQLQATPTFACFFEGWSEPWEYADDVTTAKRLSEAGFVEIKTWLKRAEFSLHGSSEYREYLSTVTLHKQLERITDEKLRDRFLDELTAEASRDSAYELDYWRLNIEAKKG